MAAIAAPTEKSHETSKSEPDNSVSFINGSATPSELDSKSGSVKDEYLGSNQEHVFSTPAILSYWKDVYEKAKYESRHRFDPLLQWSPSEEKLLLRKVFPAHFML
jgi:hypothetical protein